MIAEGRLNLKNDLISETNEFAKTIRQMIAHEDDLLNNRMNWLLVIQGLLFAALSNLSNKPKLVFVLISFGFLVSVSCMISFITGEHAIRKLLNHWDKHLEERKLKWQDFPPVFGAALDNKTFRILDRFLSPRRLLPLVFAIGWIIIFYFQIH